MYEQKDDVSKGASLIMTELENVVVNRFIHLGQIKFYVRYVTISCCKRSRWMLKESWEYLTSVYCIPHFFGLEIHPDRLQIFCKEEKLMHRSLFIITASHNETIKSLGFAPWRIHSFFYKKPRDPFGSRSFLEISHSSSQNFLRVS